MPRKTCLNIVLLAGCHLALFAIEAAAEVRLKETGSQVVFGNAYIERIFAEGSWKTAGLRNVRTGTQYAFPDAEDVVLEFADITDIHQTPERVEPVPLSQFVCQSRQLRELDGGGKQLVFSGNGHEIRLTITYELHADWFYMKKTIRVENTGAKKRFLLTMYIESLKNQLAGKHMVDVMARPMNYKPIHRSEDCFTMMEYPGGMEALFDLKYFPGRFLAPGEHYTSYPAVIGMTAKDNLEFELRQYAYKELYWYPGAPPHSYAPWILHLNWDGVPENIYPHLRKSADMGMKLFVVDARLDAYQLREDENEKWLEYELPEKARFPGGREDILEQTRIARLKIGYYLRTSQLVRRRQSWMIDHPKLADQYKTHPPLESGHYVGQSGGSCFAHRPYEEYFTNYTLDLIKNYESDFFHFDWFTSYPCAQARHNHLPNGWDAVDKQHEAFMRALMEMRKENPAIVLQSGGGCLSVHWMKWLSHSFIHDIWPGPIPDLSYTRSCGADSRERLHRYAKDGLSPMMMISCWTDAGGELTNNPFGWRDSFLNSIALTPSLRVEAGLYSYGRCELAWMKKWMDWRLTHTQGYSNVRFLWGHPYERGTEGYAFIEGSNGYLYFVNNEYADHEISVRFDESMGITDRNRQYQVKLLYPAEATLANQGKPLFRFGDTLTLKLPFKTIRYMSVSPFDATSEMQLLDRLPAQPDRWVVVTKNIVPKPSGRGSQYAAEVSLAGKELPEKPDYDERPDTSIRLNTDSVDEDPAGKAYLLVYATEPPPTEQPVKNPFPGLQVRFNDTPIGGTIRSQAHRWPRARRSLPFFYSDVTRVVRQQANTIQWQADNGALAPAEVILVREADERFSSPAPASAPPAVR